MATPSSLSTSPPQPALQSQQQKQPDRSDTPRRDEHTLSRTQRDALRLLDRHADLWHTGDDVRDDGAAEKKKIFAAGEVLLWSDFVDQISVERQDDAAASGSGHGDHDDHDDDDDASALYDARVSDDDDGEGKMPGNARTVKRTRAMVVTNRCIRLLSVENPRDTVAHIPHERLWYILYEQNRGNEGVVAILEKGGHVSAMVQLYAKFWFFDMLVQAFDMWDSGGNGAQEGREHQRQPQQRVPFMRVTRVARYVELLVLGGAVAGQQAALKFLMQQQLMNAGDGIGDAAGDEEGSSATTNVIGAAAGGGVGGGSGGTKNRKQRSAIARGRLVLPTRYADMYIGDSCHNNPWVVTVPERNVQYLFRSQVVGHGGVMNWLVRYDDTTVLYSEDVGKRTAKSGKSESVDKWIIVTERAVYLCNKSTGEMERRVLLSDISTLLIEQVLTAKLSMIIRKGPTGGGSATSTHGDRHKNTAPKSRRMVAIIVPSEFDLLIESHHADALVGVIRSQRPHVNLEYDFHPYRKCNLHVNKAFKVKMRQLHDPSHLREIIRLAVADRDEDKLSYALECCRYLGMDGGGDAMFTLGQQQLAICREFRIMKETMVAALESWDLLTLADMMQKLESDLQREQQVLVQQPEFGTSEDASALGSDYRGMNALKELHTDMKPKWEEIVKVFRWLRKGARKGSKSNAANLDEELMKSCTRRFTELASRCGDIQTLTRLMSLVKDEQLRKTVKAALFETEAMQQQVVNVRIDPEKGYVLRVALKKSCEELIEQCAKKLGLSKQSKDNEHTASTEKSVIRGMTVHVDVFDKLGYHHSTSLEFAAEKPGPEDDEGDELVALIDLESCMRRCASQIKSHQIHFVLSVEISGHHKGSERRERSIRVELIKTGDSGINGNSFHSFSRNGLNSSRSSDAPLVPQVVQEWMWSGLESSIVNEYILVSNVKQRQQQQQFSAFEPHPQHQQPIKKKRRILLCAVSKISRRIDDEDNLVDSVATGVAGIIKKKSRARSLFSRRLRKNADLVRVGAKKRSARRVEVFWNVLNVGTVIDVQIVEGGFGLSSTSVTQLRSLLGILSPPRAVIIKILSARGLAPRDRWSGKADPYIKITYGGREYRTRYKHVTLNPVWKDEECRFEIPSDEHAGHLNLECWDHDHFSSDVFMGQCRIHMGEVELTEDWYDLGPQEQTDASLVPCEGQVRLRVVFEFDAE